MRVERHAETAGKNETAGVSRAQVGRDFHFDLGRSHGKYGRGSDGVAIRVNDRSPDPSVVAKPKE